MTMNKQRIKFDLYAYRHIMYIPNLLITIVNELCNVFIDISLLENQCILNIAHIQVKQFIWIFQCIVAN